MSKQSWKIVHREKKLSMSLLAGQCLKNAAENKLDYYRERDCIEKLCKKLKDHAMKIIKYKEKEMMPLTDEENKSYEKQEICHICKKKFCLDENVENEDNGN